MKKTLLLLVLLLGCVKTKPERNVRFDLTEGDFQNLSHECSEIRAQGDILSLMNEIKIDTRKVFHLLDSEDLPSSEPLVTQLAERISQKSQLVLNLSKKEWTTSKWDHEITWRIDIADFKGVLGTFFTNGFSIQKGHVHSIYFMGEPRNDLSSQVSFTQEGNALLVHFKSKGSSLELCQLQKTLVIMAQVQYRSLASTKIRFFALNVGNEMEVIL